MSYKQIALIPIQNSEFNGTAWHLFYYIPSRKNSEPFSDSISKFKAGNSHDTKKWIDIALKELKKLNIEIDFVVRPLGSDELTINRNKSLDKLGLALANGFNAQYIPEIFEKTKPIVGGLHKAGGYTQRVSALQKVYKDLAENDEKLSSGRSILIIDDITTTDATADFLKGLIEDVYPNLIVYFFALAKTANWIAYNEYDVTLNDDFDPGILK